MATVIDWALFEPASNPTRTELRLIAMLRTIGYGKLEISMQGNRPSLVEMAIQMRPEDDEISLPPQRQMAGVRS